MAVLRATLAATPPTGAVTALTLRAQPVRVQAAQEPLLGEPRLSPRALAETIARVIGVVGAGNLGVPVLLDTHRPDAIRLEPLDALLPRCRSTRRGARAGEGGVLALRRLRPPRPAQVRLVGGRPVHFPIRRARGRHRRQRGAVARVGRVVAGEPVGRG